MVSLGKRIQTLRRKQQLSQLQLERRIGIKREYISRLERGKLKNPTLNTLKKIAHGLGVPLESLLVSDPCSKPGTGPSPHCFQDLLQQSKQLEQKISFLQNDLHKLNQMLNLMK